MTDIPILFNGTMIRALLDGRKTQTRRILKPQPDFRGGVGDYHDAEEWGWEDEDGYHISVLNILPNGFCVGDRLWVREAWRAMDGQDAFSPTQIAGQCIAAGYKRAWSPIQYEADGGRDNWIADPHTFGKQSGRLRPSIHMPRWASRMTLIVTDVRVQRLQDISEEDAQAEGLSSCSKDGNIWKWGIADRDGMPGNDDHGWHWQEWERDPRKAFARLWNSVYGPNAWGANPWVCALTFTVHKQKIDKMEAPR